MPSPSLASQAVHLRFGQRYLGSYHGCHDISPYLCDVSRAPRPTTEVPAQDTRRHLSGDWAQFAPFGAVPQTARMSTVDLELYSFADLRRPGVLAGVGKAFDADPALRPEMMDIRSE